MSASWFSISKSTLIDILRKLQTVFDTKADSSHIHTKSDITDFAHDHPLSIEAASTATSAINLDPNAIYKLTAGGKTFIFKTPADNDHYAWADISGKPSTFPPSAHTHTKSQITDFPSTMPPSSHTHGNIQNGGTLQTNDVAIANGDKLVITDSSDSSKIARASIAFDGSTATKCLTQKGTWENFTDEEDIQSSKIVSGNTITVTDAAPINAEDITVDITPQQDLHGYDRPWAGGAGKNKLPMTVDGIKAANTVGTWSGDVYTLNNGTFEILTDNADNVTGIKVNGAFSGETMFVVGNCVDITDGAYKLNGCPAGGSTSTYRLVANGSHWDTGEGADISVPSSWNKYVSIYVYTSVSNLTFYPMIRLATETDSTFAPYSNICPIEGRTGAELDRVGKNLVNWAISSPTDDALEIQLKPNTYTISASETISNGNWYLRFTDSNNAYSYTGGQVGLSNWAKASSGWFYGGETSQQIPFTVPNGCKLVEIGKLNADGTIYAQLEIGNQATAYEPYQGISRTANFGQTVYGGKWHVTEGGTMVDRAIDSNLGSHTWVVYYSTDRVHRFETNDTFPMPQEYNNPNMISSAYRTVSWAEGNTNTDGVMYKDAAGHIFVNNLSCNTAEEIKAAMDGVQLVYELATPTTISTREQNVPMLEGINTVSADCGDVSLKYQPDNVVGELKGEIEKASDSAAPKFLNYASNPHDEQQAESAFGVGVRLRRDRGYVSIDNVSLFFWQNYPIADFYYEIQSHVPTDFIPEYDVEKLFLHINGQSFLNIILTNTGILKLRMYSPVRIVDNYPNVFWLQTADETGCKEAKY